jgi:hypothetical protein
MGLLILKRLAPHADVSHFSQGARENGAPGSISEEPEFRLSMTNFDENMRPLQYLCG